MCTTSIEHTVRNRTSAVVEVVEMIPTDRARGAEEKFLGEVVSQGTRTFTLPPKHWLHWRFAGPVSRRESMDRDRLVVVTNRCLPAGDPR